MLTEEFEWKAQSKHLFGYRQSEDIGEYEMLVELEGLPIHESIWESFEGMHYCFPELHLEATMLETLKGDVRPPITIL